MSISDFLPSISTPDYPTMLKKIGFYSGLILAISSFLALYQSGRASVVEPLIAKIPDVFGFSTGFPLLALVLFFIGVVVSNAVKLHDRLSDWMYIRHNFDISNIIVPILAAARIPPPPELDAKRDSVMRTLFYTYADSSKDDTLVSSHNIEQALTNWSWYWICLEGIFWVCVFIAIYLAIGLMTLAGAYSLVLLGLVISATFFYRTARDHARAQVEQITSSKQALAEIRAALK